MSSVFTVRQATYRLTPVSPPPYDRWVKVKVKVQFTLEQATKARHLDGALDGVGDQRHAPAVLTPRETLLPVV